MDIKEIIKNLEHYNNWRRDNDNEYTMPEPKQIGLTIDAAISELNKLLICDVRQQRELLLAFTKHMYKQHWHGSQGHLKELITEFLESQ